MRVQNPRTVDGPGRLEAPGLLRRLAAAFYDALLLASAWLLAAIPLVFIPEPLRAHPGLRVLIQLYLAAVGLGLFAAFWVHGGQTPGMRAWRLRVVRDSGAPLGWRQAVARALAACLSWACLGLGFAWVLFDKERRAWHDRLSATRLVLVPRAVRRR